MANPQKPAGVAWAGPALFIAVALALVVFFIWLL